MVGLTVAIMAGGKSSRMGTDKSFVTILGKPIIEQVLRNTADLGQSETILIVNRPADYNSLKLPMFEDVLPERGSLGGIYTALYYSSQPYTMVLACDMPFLSPTLLRYMVGLCEGDQFDVIVPRVDGFPQGLHAIYRKTCLQPIRERLGTGQFKVIGFYERMRVRYLDEVEYLPYDPKKRSFFNVNTPEDLAEAQRQIEANS